MAYSEVSTATDHNDLLSRIVTFVSATIPVAERHTILRNTTETSTIGDLVAEKVAILKAPGLAGVDNIYYGLKVYKSVSLDYYNFQIDGFTGYVSGNTFESQPGSILGTGVTGLGVTLWNQAIPYWLVADGQGFICVAKVQNTYVTFSAGFMLKFATFSQFPYPLTVQSNLPSASATRYSDINWISGWKGARQNMVFRFTDGTWKQPQVIPYKDNYAYRNTINNSNTAAGYYSLIPLELTDAVGTGNLYGILANQFFITGFNNAVENTLVVGGVTYVVFRDGTKTGNLDYMALKLG
jgi:hypothetical protein